MFFSRIDSSTRTAWCCTGASSMSSQKKARVYKKLVWERGWGGGGSGYWTPPPSVGSGSSRRGRGIGGQNGPQADTDALRHPHHNATGRFVPTNVHKALKNFLKHTSLSCVSREGSP
jgi:hypothetical protein